MYTFILIISIIVCVLLVLIVLVQNSKGGGLAANFSGSTQVMGVRKTADFLEKATWTFAGAILVLSICASIASKNVSTVRKPRVEQVNTEQTPIPSNALPDMQPDNPLNKPR